MRITSVQLARAFAVFPLEDLDPKGTLFYPDLVKKLVERYEFQKYPTKQEDFDEAKGIEFHTGRSGKIVIDKVVLWTNGIHVDTQKSTDTSESILRDALVWASQEFDLHYDEKMMFARRAYLSNLNFVTDVPILKFHSTMERACQLLSNEVAQNFGQNIKYEPAGTVLTFDPQSTSFGTSYFALLRREKTSWTDNHYFSASPLRTDVHKQLLQQIEDDLSEGV